MIMFLLGVILLFIVLSLAINMWPYTLGLLAVGGWFLFSYVVMLLLMGSGMDFNLAIIMGVCTLFAPVWYLNQEKS